MSERMLAEQDGYEASLLWLREEDASVCLTGPGLMTAHIPLAQWKAFADVVGTAYARMLACPPDRLFVDDTEGRR